jgi:hypothetical protein
MSPALRLASWLTVAIVPLAATASAAGLILPGLYRDPSAVVPAMRGQDLVVLLCLPVLVGTIGRVQRGSPRATLIWIGLLGYLVYTYTGAAFAYRFNHLFLIYIALFSLSAAALLAALRGIDMIELARKFDPATPRRPVAAYVVFIALLLGVSELSQLISALVYGRVPALISRSEGAGNFVYVLDLGIIAPLALLAAMWLLQERPWGYVLAGFMLIKAITMGLALLAGTWLSVRAGAGFELGLTLGYAVIAFGSMGAVLWFFRHCRT